MQFLRIPVLLITLFAVFPSYGLTCRQMFSPHPYKAFETQFDLSPTAKKLIKEAKAQVDGTVPRAVALRDLSALKEKLLQLELAPELINHENKNALSFLEAFKFKTTEQVENLIHLVENNQPIKVEQLIEAALRGSLVFQASAKARDSYMAIFNRGLTVTPETRKSWEKSFVSDVNLYRYDDVDIAEYIQKLKDHRLQNPMIQIKMTFEDVNEADLYHLIKRRIFVVGVTDVFLSVDNNVLGPSVFLKHDLGHLYGFFGYSDRTAVYDKPNKRSTDVAEKLVLWNQLDSGFSRLENKIREGLKDGHIKHSESAIRFLFELNHEVSNSIYLRLQRQFKKLSDEETVIEILRMITGHKINFLQFYEDKTLVSEITSDLEWMTQQSQIIFVEPN